MLGFGAHSRASGSVRDDQSWVTSELFDSSITEHERYKDTSAVDLALMLKEHGVNEFDISDRDDMIRRIIAMRALGTTAGSFSRYGLARQVDVHALEERAQRKVQKEFGNIREMITQMRRNQGGRTVASRSTNLCSCGMEGLPPHQHLPRCAAAVATAAPLRQRRATAQRPIVDELIVAPHGGQDELIKQTHGEEEQAVRSPLELAIGDIALSAERSKLASRALQTSLSDGSSVETDRIMLRSGRTSLQDTPSVSRLCASAVFEAPSPPTQNKLSVGAAELLVLPESTSHGYRKPSVQHSVMGNKINDVERQLDHELDDGFTEFMPRQVAFSSGRAPEPKVGRVMRLYSTMLQCVMSTFSRLVTVKKRRKTTMQTEGNMEKAKYRKQMSLPPIVQMVDHDAERKKQKFKNLVIHPDNMLRVWWDTIILVLTLYYGFSVPFEFCFIDADEEASVVMKTLELVFTGAFAVDICLAFCTAFTATDGPRKGLLVTDKGKIVSKYVATWFPLDFVSTMPWDNVIPESASESINPRVFKALRGIKLLRVARVSRLITRFQYRFRLNPAYLRLGVTIIGTVLFWHLIACVYWYISDETGLGSDIWVPPLWYTERGVMTKYGRSFMWAICVTTGQGFDIDPQDPIENWFTITSIIGGIFMYTVMIGSVSNALSNMDVQEAGKAQKEDALNDYFTRRGIPEPLQERITDYYEYMWVTHSSNETGKLLQDLHESLRIELSVCENADLVAKVPLFRHIDENTLVAVVQCLKPRIYLPDEFVILAGDEGHDMYIVLRGLVNMYNYQGLLLAHISEGGFFGERALMNSQTRRNRSVRSCDHCEILVLNKRPFNHLYHSYPDFRMSIEKYAPNNLSSKMRRWDLVRSMIALLIQVRRLGSKMSFNEMLDKMGSQADQDSHVDVDDDMNSPTSLVIANAMDTRVKDGNEFVAKRKILGHKVEPPPASMEVVSIQEQERRQIAEIMKTV